MVIVNAADVTTSKPPGDRAGHSRLSRWYDWAAAHFRKLLGVVIVAVVGVVVQQVAVRCTAADAPLGPTQVHYMHLFTERGKLVPPFKETERHSGATCLKPSKGTDDPSAWRCFTPDDYIRDPCWYKPWAAPDNNSLACVDSPWDHDVVVVETASWSGTEQSLRPPRPRARPWAMELRNPAHHDQSVQCVSLSVSLG
jgi:hypothetical protein